MKRKREKSFDSGSTSEDNIVPSTPTTANASKTTSADPKAKKPRGRPKGSTNKNKSSDAEKPSSASVSSNKKKKLSKDNSPDESASKAKAQVKRRGSEGGKKFEEVENAMEAMFAGLEGGGAPGSSDRKSIKSELILPKKSLSTKKPSMAVTGAKDKKTPVILAI